MRTGHHLAAAVTVTAVMLAACSSAPAPSAAPSTTAPSTTAPSTTAPSSTSATTRIPTPIAPRTSGTTAAAPTRYLSVVVHHGSDHPDDLALDGSGALLFSDYTDGTISRLAADGTVTVLHHGLDGPEGLVPLADGTLVVAEENTNRVLAYSPGASAPHVLRRLPGTPSTRTCHQGVDGLAWDPTTRTLVVPDPVTGTVYRLTTDGRTLTTLAAGFVHPVGAVVDTAGSVYVADECGGDVWRLGAGGRRTRVARAVMPDDLALDGRGNLLVSDVRHTRHDVRTWPLAGGTSRVLARTGLVEPQGLLVTASGVVWVSDDIARVLLRLTPVTGAG